VREEGADVVVIGAGLAGLVAARELRRSGIRAVVVEARERVGGRTLNHPIGDGKVVEIGGQWVGPGQDRVIALIDELGLERYDTHDHGKRVIERRGRVRSYRGDIPKVTPVGLVDTQIAISRLERMARSVPAEAPWTAAKAAEWDAQTFATWIRRNVRTSFGRDLLTLSCEAVWATDPADLSLLHLLAYCNASGGLERLISTADGAQQQRIVGGSQLISLRMAEELGDAVILAAPVRAVAHDDAGVTVSGETVTVSARRAVVAMSPTLAGRLVYSPGLPAARDQLTQRVPQGAVIKCMAIYDEPFWRAAGFSGQAISDAGPIKVGFDNTPPDGTPGVLLGFLEGSQARKLGAWPAAERRAAVVGCFERFFGPRGGQPIDYVEKSWIDDEWARGCYGAFMAPNTWSAFGHALREPIGPIHWAGAETASVGMGYMDGAVRTGERAAAEVAAGLAA
jgi:monoamine oxidase